MFEANAQAINMTALCRNNLRLHAETVAIRFLGFISDKNASGAAVELL
jgi:hypothetical protein